jgi:hypothetical protein
VKKASAAISSGVQAKSNLKNEEDKKEQIGRKRSVTYGGATVYEI